MSKVSTVFKEFVNPRTLLDGGVIASHRVHGKLTDKYDPVGKAYTGSGGILRPFDAPSKETTDLEVSNAAREAKLGNQKVASSLEEDAKKRISLGAY